MANTNIINAVFGSGICAVTTSAFRANYGMVLRFSGIDLPTAFEVDFSNYDVMGRDSITMIGQDNEVQIPDDLWESGLNIYAYVYLHPTDDSGVTVYTVTIPVLGRPNRTEEEPTPHEQTLIEQAISALNDAVEQTAADVVAADASAQAAAQSEANAESSERSAAASASAALASQNAAESASQSATESASASAESARNAAVSASQAAQSATAAQESAEQAEQAVQSITDDVERAERAAATATGEATEASASAATASTKAAQAEQSATAAAQSASSASTAAQNAASSATDAQSSATDAETAKQAAQDAQAAAETAAESVSGLSAQIAQNTADIADLVQSKAGALIDTVSGSIASFVPDATIPTVRGLTVEVEPVQDLHGYDSPWPSGGGKNLLHVNSRVSQTTAGVTYSSDDEYIYLNGTKSGQGYVSLNTMTLDLESGTYYARAFAISGTTSNSVAIYANDGTSDFGGNINGALKTYTITEPTTIRFRFLIVTDGTVLTNYKIGIVVSKSSDIDVFTPYSNICPISGWDAVNVKHSGAEMTNPTTYTIQLGQTVYGGTLDVTSGKMVVDRAEVDLGTLTWTYFNIAGHYRFVAYPQGIKSFDSNILASILCSVYAVDTANNVFNNVSDKRISSGGGALLVYDSDYSSADDFKTAMSGVQLVYELATPITVDIAPLEISVLTGQTNNVWADSGNVSVEYAADLKTYIDQKIAAAVAALS